MAKKNKEQPKPEHLGRFANRGVEQSILGAVLFDERAWNDLISEGLCRELFFDEGHKLIFDCIKKQFERFGTADLVLVSEGLRASGDLETVGGAAYISDLLDAVPTVAHARHYLRQAKDLYKVREVWTSTFGILKKIEETEPIQASNIVVESTNDLQKVLHAHHIESTLPLGSLAEDARTYLEDVSAGAVVPGLKIPGMPELDRLLNGLHAGESIIIAGDPKHGKSSLAFNIAWDVCAGDVLAIPQSYTPVAHFSMEMQKIMLLFRAMGRRAGLGYHRLQRGEYSKDQFIKLDTLLKTVPHMPFFAFEDRLTMDNIVAKATFLREVHSVKLIVIDYLQLIEKRHSRMNMWEHIQETSKEIKALATKLKVPIITISSVNRSGTVARKEGGQFGAEHLYGGGSIIYDCDVLIFIERQLEKELLPNFAEIYTHIRVDAQRNGPTGTIDTLFRKRTMEFVEVGSKEEGEKKMDNSRYNSKSGETEAEAQEAMTREEKMQEERDDVPF